jgi:hypothetical protein
MHYPTNYGTLGICAPKYRWVNVLLEVVKEDTSSNGPFGYRYVFEFHELMFCTVNYGTGTVPSSLTLNCPSRVPRYFFILYTCKVIDMVPILSAVPYGLFS